MMYWRGGGLKSLFFTGGVEANFPFVNSVLAWLAPVHWYNYVPTELQNLHKIRSIFPFYQWYIQGSDSHQQVLTILLILYRPVCYYNRKMCPCVCSIHHPVCLPRILPSNQYCTATHSPPSCPAQPHNCHHSMACAWKSSQPQHPDQAHS